MHRNDTPMTGSEHIDTERTTDARLPVSSTTRDEDLKPLKRGGETYDELLQRMAAQYDPEPDIQPIEYDGITSFRGGGFTVEGVQLSVDAVHAVRVGVTDGPEDVWLSEDNRACKPTGGRPTEDVSGFEKVGVVSDNKDGGQKGIVYAEITAGPDPRWYWLPYDDEGEDP